MNTKKTREAGERGILRPVDSLGRMVIPVEWRRALGLDEDHPAEILFMGDHIEVRPYAAGCAFCGAGEGLTEHRGKFVCRRCRAELSLP